MRVLSVSDLVGIGMVPGTPFGIRKWLKHHAIPVQLEGKRFTFALSDLPETVRRAVIERDIATSGLPAGEYDADAHDTLAAATPAMRDEAERKAGAWPVRSWNG